MKVMLKELFLHWKLSVQSLFLYYLHMFKRIFHFLGICVKKKKEIEKKVADYEYQSFWK